MNVKRAELMVLSAKQRAIQAQSVAHSDSQKVVWVNLVVLQDIPEIKNIPTSFSFLEEKTIKNIY